MNTLLPERAKPRERRWSEGSLSTTDVSRSFEGVHALQGVSLSIERHEVVGLIGPNGAGKTTLINLITGFDLPSSGRIVLGQEDVTRWQARRRAHAGLARTFQHGHLFRGLSVAENIQLGALGIGMSARHARTVCSELLEALDLKERASMPAAAGLAESDIISFANLVRRVRDEYGAGVLLVDHNMALIMDVCDRIHVLDQGRTLASGTPAEIRRNIDVTAAYLGSSGVKEQAEPDA
jgi:branched-chain amino acid transport system ATP-binding protein